MNLLVQSTVERMLVVTAAPRTQCARCAACVSSYRSPVSNTLVFFVCDFVCGKSCACFIHRVLKILHVMSGTPRTHLHFASSLLYVASLVFLIVVVLRNPMLSETIDKGLSAVVPSDLSIIRQIDPAKVKIPKIISKDNRPGVRCVG
jgi:hypothetical protein